MELDFAVLADSVMTRPDGKLDLYGAGFDTIFARAVPAVHPRLVVVARILISAREASESHRLNVLVRGPDGQQVANAHGELAALGEEQRSQIPAERPAGVGLILPFENVVFETYGNYEVVISLDDDPVRTLPIYVQELAVSTEGR